MKTSIKLSTNEIMCINGGVGSGLPIINDNDEVCHADAVLLTRNYLKTIGIGAFFVVSVAAKTVFDLSKKTAVDTLKNISL